MTEIVSEEAKKQREMWIAAATWDSDILMAAWIDNSKAYPDFPTSSPEVLGFSISDDGGMSWKRLKRTLDKCNPGCDPDVDCFEEGSSLTLDDICYEWVTLTQGDPAVAATGDPNDAGKRRYFYFVGLDGGTADFFARLKWTDPLVGWETAPLPGGGGHTCKVAADPLGEDVYVVWQGVSLTASRTAGDDFITYDPQFPPPMEGRQIGYKPSVGSVFPPVFAVGAVGPAGGFNVVWWLVHVGGENPSTEIRYRRGTWNGNTLNFVPPLPDESAENCIEDVDCAESIVHGHEGHTVGYGAPLLGSLSDRTTRMKGVSWPSIAIDGNSLTTPVPAEVQSTLRTPRRSFRAGRRATRLSATRHVLSI